MKKQNTSAAGKKIDIAAFMASEKPSRVPALIKTQAVDLIEAGYSLAQTQRFLTSNGFTASRSTIAAWHNSTQKEST